VPQPPKRCLSR